MIILTGSIFFLVIATSTFSSVGGSRSILVTSIAIRVVMILLVVVYLLPSRHFSCWICFFGTDEVIYSYHHFCYCLRGFFGEPFGQLRTFTAIDKRRYLLISGTPGIRLASSVHHSLNLGRVSLACRMIFVISIGSLMHFLRRANLVTNCSLKASQPSMLARGKRSNHPLAASSSVC
jgi:hypothetical protein